MNEDTIVKCFCCTQWVRVSATVVQPTGERELDERWCVGCIDAVDEYTKEIQMGELSVTNLELEGGEDDQII